MTPIYDALWDEMFGDDTPVYDALVADTAEARAWSDVYGIDTEWLIQLSRMRAKVHVGPPADVPLRDYAEPLDRIAFSKSLDRWGGWSP